MVLQSDANDGLRQNGSRCCSVAGLIGRFILKLDYNTLTGVLSGATTNPPALAFAGEQDKDGESAAVGYATVYPLTMFIRVLVAQLMILFLC